MIKGYRYNSNRRELIKLKGISNIAKFIEKKNHKVWVDLENPSDKDYEKLKEMFGFHPLTIEDCKLEITLPKIDEYDDYLFLVFHRIVHSREKGEIAVREMDFFLGKNYLVSVHKEKSSSINNMEKKIEARPRFMERGSDFLMHGIIDMFIDKYLPIIEEWSDEIEDVEDMIIARKITKTMQKIINMKRNIVDFKKSITPQRDIIAKLSRREFRFISEKAAKYYMDVYDNLMWAYTNLESNRDLLTSAFEAYLSVISNKANESSNRMNKIMQRLTIIATIFMPLTFITGVYGMNFKFMPELAWRFGYFFSLGVMILIAVVMLTYFRKKYWVD